MNGFGVMIPLFFFYQRVNILIIPPVYIHINLVATRVHSSGFVCTDTATKQVTVLDQIPAQINVAPGRFCAPYTLNVNAGNISGFSQVEWIIYDSSTAQGEFHLSMVYRQHMYIM